MIRSDEAAVTPETEGQSAASGDGKWSWLIPGMLPQERLRIIVQTVREMSAKRDPQEMVRTYAERMQELFPVDRRVSLSRRGLAAPEVRVTRYSGWEEDVNPWKTPDRLPLLSRGLLSELIYGDEPRIIDDLRLAEDDPAREFLAGQRSLMAIPLYDGGSAINMVVVTRAEPFSFPHEDLPERVWMSNLFGQAAQNLVLAEQRDVAYQEVNRELQVVADIQRSLLPRELPDRPEFDIAAHYQTSRQVGGDYYDFFNLPGGKLGILIADVSGHGTSAAVVMALVHCIAHLFDREPCHPSDLLNFVNAQVTKRYTSNSGHFVTAFFAIWDPQTRRLEYSCAGQNPPRLQRCGDPSVYQLSAATSFPLGIFAEHTYPDATIELKPGDRLVLYTDGIVEAEGYLRGKELFGTDRLDRAIQHCHLDAAGTRDKILADLDQYTGGLPASDDRTLLIIDVREAEKREQEV